MKKEKWFSRKTVLIAGGIVGLCAIIIFLIVVYSRYTTHTQVQGIARVLHLPVLVVWRPFSVLTTTELQWKLTSLRQFYEKQDFSSLGMRVDFSTTEGKKRLLVRERGLMNKYIEDQVVERLVRDAGMRVTSAEVDQSVARKLHEFGSEDQVRNDLERLYGWNLDDFKREVVMPELYKEKLIGIFDAREDKSRDTKASKEIQEALGQLETGSSFSDVAKKYSEGSTTENGGEIGWVDISQAEPNLAEAIENLAVGKRSGIIETSLGYHIVHLHETRKESGVLLYRVSQIIVRKETIVDWIGTAIKDTPLWVFLPDYRWNAESGYVEFASPSMVEFEAKNGFTGTNDLLLEK
jgi:hypothetical protein